MTLTDRDRKIAMGLIPFVLVMAYWFLLIAPKREEAATVGESLASEQQRLSEAQGRAGTLAAAEESFARDYAVIVKLGKAVPASVDMPSLLVQVEQAAKGTGIELEKMVAGARVPLAESTSAAASAAAPAPAPAAAEPAGAAPSGDAPQSAPGEAAASAEDAAETASAPPATADGTAAAAPAGAAAPRALEAVPLDFSINGSFFEMAGFFHRLKRFVYVDGDRVRVRGRLMTIDAVQYTAADFPTLTANVKATVFVTPKAEGVTAGASPAGPATPAAAPADTSNASSGASAAPPTAAATP
jgi:hypothetical protein